MWFAYLFAAIAGVVLLGASLLGAHGHGHGHDGHDGDADHGRGAGTLLSLRVWSNVLAFGGLTGVLLRVATPLGEPWSGVVALGVGVAAAALSTALIHRASSDAAGASQGDEVAGRTAQVLVPFGRGRTGKVRVQLDGRTVDLLANTDDAELAAREEVLIVDARDGATVHVGRRLVRSTMRPRGDANDADEAHEADEAVASGRASAFSRASGDGASGPLPDTRDGVSTTDDAALRSLLARVAAAPPVALDRGVLEGAELPAQIDGRFRRLERLGRGGMGEVHRAFDERLHRDVALKVLASDLVDRPERRARMLREARAGARINHPNVAAIYDESLEGPVPYIAMEFVAGRTLRARLVAGALPGDVAAALFREVVDGVAAAHAVGVVHRDLKPENVMLTDEDRVKVLDFGLARIEREPAEAARGEPAGASDDVAVTRDAQVFGTPAYMAPEQARGERTDARTDVFALGLLYFEMLTGRTLVARPSARATVDALGALREDDVAAALKPLPPAARKLLARCLAPRPDARFVDARALRAALGAR